MDTHTEKPILFYMDELLSNPPVEPRPPFLGDTPSAAVNPRLREPNQKITHVPDSAPKDLHVDRVEPVDHDAHQQQQKYQDEKQEKAEEAGDHFESLAKAAEQAHKILEKNKSPYRFCIFKKDGKVFIDLILLGSDGKVIEGLEKDITHEEFSNWIQHINKQEGMFFDQKF